MNLHSDVQVPLWPPNIDLTVETDRWEELGAVTRDTKDNKPVLRQKRPSAASWSSQPTHTRYCSNICTKHSLTLLSIWALRRL